MNDESTNGTSRRSVLKTISSSIVGLSFGGGAVSFTSANVAADTDERFVDYITDQSDSHSGIKNTTILTSTEMPTASTTCLSCYADLGPGGGGGGDGSDDSDDSDDGSSGGGGGTTDPNDPPNVSLSYSPDEPVTHKPLSIAAEVTDSDDSSFSYDWSFPGASETYTGDYTGGGSTAFPTATYDSAGTYTASVTVDDGEDSDSDSVDIQVTNPEPEVTIRGGDKSIKTNESIQLTADTNDNGSIISCEWDFSGPGASVTDNGTVTTQSFSARGWYTATVTVTDDGGKTATASYMFKVINQSPNVEITSDGLMPKNSIVTIANAEVTFTADASDPENDPLSYEWKIYSPDMNGSNNSTYSGQSCTHTFSQTCGYLVEVVVSDGKTESKATQAVIVSRAQDIKVEFGDSKTEVFRVVSLDKLTRAIISMKENGDDKEVFDTYLHNVEQDGQFMLEFS